MKHIILVILFLNFYSCAKSPSCFDGEKNGDETEVDCGGICPVCIGKFNIGQTGPGGGVVFYDKGSRTNGWQYLEASRVDQATSAKWGCFGLEILGTQRIVGAGLENQNIVIEKCAVSVTSPEYEKAFAVCADYSVGIYDDWFLPSRDELNEMYVKKSIIGGFQNTAYWSSTETRDEDAWLQEFGTGDQYDDFKNEGKRVRAIRRF